VKKKKLLVNEPESGLQVSCVECRNAIAVSFPIGRQAFAHVVAKLGWYLSVLTPPGQPGLVLLGPVCNECAPRVYEPDLLKAAEEARLRLVATIGN
jgi:hypothetical protein